MSALIFGFLLIIALCAIPFQVGLIIGFLSHAGVWAMAVLAVVLLGPSILTLLAVPAVLKQGFFFSGYTALSDTYAYLARALRDGVSLRDALAAATTDAKSGILKRALTRVQAGMGDSGRMWQASRCASVVFPGTDRAVIQAGEESGRLEEAFRLLAGSNRVRSITQWPTVAVGLQVFCLTTFCLVLSSLLLSIILPSAQSAVFAYRIQSGGNDNAILVLLSVGQAVMNSLFDHLPMTLLCGVGIAIIAHTLLGPARLCRWLARITGFSADNFWVLAGAHMAFVASAYGGSLAESGRARAFADAAGAALSSTDKREVSRRLESGEGLQEVISEVRVPLQVRQCFALGEAGEQLMANLSADSDMYTPLGNGPFYPLVLFGPVMFLIVFGFIPAITASSVSYTNV